MAVVRPLILVCESVHYGQVCNHLLMSFVCDFGSLRTSLTETDQTRETCFDIARTAECDHFKRLCPIYQILDAEMILG